MKTWCVLCTAALAGAASGQAAFEDVEVVSGAGSAIEELSVGDVDGDGHAGLVVERLGASDGFEVVLGDGLGGFGEPSAQPGVTPGIAGHLLADVDGDGVRELVVLETAREVVVYSFVGGAFVVDQVVELPDQGVALAVGHLDRDAFDDVLVANASVGRIHVVYGSAGGLVVAPDLLGVVGAADIALGDVDANGFTDVLVLDATVSPSAELVVLAQQPGGGFDRIDVDVADGAGSGLRVESGDVDGDGVDDVAVATTAGPPRVAFGAPGVGLGASVGLSSAAPRADLYDFDGDGDVEILDGDTSAFGTDVRLYDWNRAGFQAVVAPGARAVAADFPRAAPVA